jgi:hypothetical protein
MQNRFDGKGARAAKFTPQRRYFLGGSYPPYVFAISCFSRRSKARKLQAE